MSEPKTPGRIAHEAFWGAHGEAGMWDVMPKVGRAVWEAVAQAVLVRASAEGGACAAITRVRALHHPTDTPDPMCELCSKHGDTSWPCATLAALDAAADECHLPHAPVEEQDACDRAHGINPATDSPRAAAAGTSCGYCGCTIPAEQCTTCRHDTTEEQP